MTNKVINIENFKLRIYSNMYTIPPEKEFTCEIVVE